jgi:branched-chain amino acid transport system substrate-binding protein
VSPQTKTLVFPAAARILVTAVLVGLLASLLVAPGDAAQRGPRAPSEVVVGAILDLKSGWTSLGRASRVTLQLAAADANVALAQRGSPLHVRLRLVDAQGKPALALHQLRRLAAGGVHVVVGPEGSSEVAAVRKAANSLGVVVISQGSTAHSLAIAGDNVLRFLPDDVHEGEALVALLRRERIDALVPVWRRDAGNVGLARSVRRQFAATGGKVSRGVSYATTTANFAPVASSIAAQAATLRASGAKHLGVYLAAFDEAVDLFHVTRFVPTLQVLPWYGSDGVALSTRLVSDRSAAAFADAVGYPNPTVGLSDALRRRARPLLVRARERLGRTPDALALTAYDALRIAVDARRGSSNTSGARLRRAIASAANGHIGVTGRMTLNRAGDRAYGNFDFWSICAAGPKFVWSRTFEYAARRAGSGRILTRTRC